MRGGGAEAGERRAGVGGEAVRRDGAIGTRKSGRAAPASAERRCACAVSASWDAGAVAAASGIGH